MPTKNRAILHVDGDGFFASCEIALNPKLKGLPVVTGQERGIATAMSPEAKQLGISRGMPVFQIRKLYPQAVVVNSNYKSYGIFAQRMYDIVRRFTDRVEEYSIDECFADITSLERPNLSYVQIARAVKEALQSELGITFSIGLAPTKVLAKVASKWQKPNGFTVIEPGEIKNFLSKLQVGKVWGIGPATSIELQRFGINTALDLVNRPQGWVEESLSRPILETWYELQGLTVYKVHTEEDDLQKSIQSTRTFSPASGDKRVILSELSRNVENACARARAQGLVARRIYYFLKTQEFRYHRREVLLATGLQSPEAILEEITQTFDTVYRPQTIYRATGVTLAGLVPVSELQNDLFGYSVGKGQNRELWQTVDAIDKKFGTGSVTLASSLKAQQKRGTRPHKDLIIPSMGEVS